MKRLTAMMFLTMAMLGCQERAHDTPASEPEAEAPVGDTADDGADKMKAGAPAEESEARADEGGPHGAAPGTPPPPAKARREGPAAAPSVAVGGTGEGRRWRPADPFDVGQAAGVAAGEWDDNANYQEFQRFIEASSRLSFSNVDLRHRRFLVVRDVNGMGVPSCKVSVSDGQNAVSLTTAASGRAILFPHAEGLTGFNLTASTRCADDEQSVKFTLEASDDLVDLRLDTARSLPQVRDIEIAFILDTTGSMSEEIAAVKATIQKVASQLSTSNVRVRMALVEYKDQTDEFVTKVYPMSTDLRGFARTVSNITASGGGDTPEDAAEGLRVGINNLQWSDSAVSRMAFLIGDAPPHLDYQSANYVRDMKSAAKRGIKLYTVAASGMDDLGQVVWRQLAQYTGGTNMFVKRGGAGAASTGGGDPKSSCGGTHDNYRSGNLDQLIVSKVEQELKDLDQSPLRIAGLRIDENAKPCNERIAQN